MSTTSDQVLTHLLFETDPRWNTSRATHFCLHAIFLVSYRQAVYPSLQPGKELRRVFSFLKKTRITMQCLSVLQNLPKVTVVGEAERLVHDVHSAGKTPMQRSHLSHPKTTKFHSPELHRNRSGQVALSVSSRRLSVDSVSINQEKISPASKSLMTKRMKRMLKQFWWQRQRILL